MVHSRQSGADVAHRRGRHLQPVDRAPVVARQCEVDAGEGRHRAAGAHQPDIVLVRREQLGKAPEGVADALAHAAVGGEPLLGRGEGAAFAFGQRHHPPGGAPPAFDPGLAAVGVDQDELGRAAADVEDERRAVAGLEQPVAAEHGEPGLLFGRDDFEADAGLAPHPLDELAAVDRAPAASVATERDSDTRRRFNFSAQTESAATARSIAPSLILPDVAIFSPSRTTREKASITVKPPSVGRATSRRQLLVPRSIAP